MRHDATKALLVSRLHLFHDHLLTMNTLAGKADITGPAADVNLMVSSLLLLLLSNFTFSESHLLQICRHKISQIATLTDTAFTA